MWSMASANDSTVSNETLNCVENILKNNGMPTDSYANKFPSDPTVDLEDIVLESKKITKTSVKKYSQEFLEMQNIKIEDENTDYIGASAHAQGVRVMASIRCLA